jgi:hypothetical protein
LKLNSIDGAHVATRPPPTTTIETGSPSTERAVTTRPSPATTTPLLIDDGGAWVQESGSYTSSTTPQVVHDGQDAVAEWSTTMAPKTTQETVIVDPSPAGSTQVYIPSWSEHTCVATDETASKNKNRRLGSSWHSYFTSQYECCVNNFIYSLELFESCVGFDLETLEPVSGGNSEYYPIWKEAWFDTKSTKPKSLCKATDGTEDGWLQTTFRPKKYLCCFEYFKWDFDNCLIA